MSAWEALTGAARAGAERLRAAWEAPQAAQAALLARLMRAASASDFGRVHKVDEIEGPDALRRRVPIRDHAGFSGWIDRVAAGERSVLSAADPVCFEETSGSNGARKLIPYTQALLGDFREAALPWLDAAFAHLPTPQGALYVAVSPAAREPFCTAGGTPVGLPDAAYLGPQLGAALTSLLAVTPQVAALGDVAAWRRATLAGLVESEDLTLVSVWSPTFFSTLLDAISQEAEALAASVSRGGRARLDAALAGAGLDAGRLWPRLAVVSCWRDGPSAAFAQELGERLRGVTLHAKGLLATEAAVTTPLRLASGVEARAPALLSTFLEFIDEGETPRGAHELVEGGVYRVVVTTAGGLYRYDLGDRVICERFEVAGALRVPSLAFLGREAVSDLVGEKLSEAFVAQALTRAPAPAALRPRGDRPGYDLLIESVAAPAVLAAWRDAVEEALSANPHYAYALRMRQLDALRVESIARLDALFADGFADGARLAMIKPRAIVELS